MNIEQSVVDAEILLNKMRKFPKEVLKVIGDEELVAVITELDDLAEKLAITQSSADLLQLIYTIYDLVNKRQELSKLLIVGKAEQQRGVTSAEQLTTTEINRYIQHHAPQIRNEVIECRTKLKALLDNKMASENNTRQGQDHDS